MSVVPAAADEMPTPDDELAVSRVTCENCAWYAGPHWANSGAISELPVSDSVADADAGVVSAAGAAEDGDGGKAPELPLHAARARTAAEVNTVKTAARLRARLSRGGRASSAAFNNNVPSLALNRSAD